MLLASLLAAATIGGPGAAADAALAHAVRRYADVHTVQASFEQTLMNPVTGTTVTAHGEYLQERPKHLSVRFTDPAEDADDRIVADGASVWIYVPSATPGRVVRMPISTAGAGGGTTQIDFIGQYLTAPEQHYTVADGGSEMVDGHTTRIVVLTPKDESNFTQVKLWIDEDDGTVRVFETKDVNETVRHVHLTKIAFNVPVTRAMFTFTPPPGVKVVDRSTLSGETS